MPHVCSIFANCKTHHCIDHTQLKDVSVQLLLTGVLANLRLPLNMAPGHSPWSPRVCDLIADQLVASKEAWDHAPLAGPEGTDASGLTGAVFSIGITREHGRGPGAQGHDSFLFFIFCQNASSTSPWAEDQSHFRRGEVGMSCLAFPTEGPSPRA